MTSEVPVAQVFGDVQEAIRLVADRVGPAVVGVGRGGSGFVVGEGLVATNAHNLHDEPVVVTFADGRRAEGRATGIDVDGDLAVIGVDTGGVAPLAWAAAPARLGDVVVALANGGGRGLRVTVGTVSSVRRAFRGPRGRRISGSLEHTAPLARGSSGGPVVDAGGSVVGVNTHRLQDGFYLALPADDQRRGQLDALARGDVPVRRRLGAAVVPPPAATRLRAAVGLDPVDGLLVRGVEPESAAARAGIQRGDVLVRAADRGLGSVDDLHELLDGVGDTLVLAVVRGVEELEIQVRFDEGATRTGEA